MTRPKPPVPVRLSRPSKLAAEIAAGTFAPRYRETRLQKMDRPPHQPVPPRVFEAEVLEYSHSRRIGTVLVTVKDNKKKARKQQKQLVVNDDHLRAAGYLTLRPGQLILVQTDSLIVDTLRVTAILSPYGVETQSSPAWLMKS